MRQATFQAKTSHSTRVFQESSAAEHNSVSMEPPGYGIELADGRPGEKVVSLPVAPIIQAKLMIGPPDDEYEQEADLVAESVMRMPSSVSPAKPEMEEKKLEPGTVQTKPLAAQITPFVQRQTDVGNPDNKEEEERVQLEPLVPHQPRIQPSADLSGDFHLSAFSQGINHHAAAESRQPESWLRKMSVGTSSNGHGMEGAARFAIQHKGPGESMPAGTRNRLEAGTGADLNHVRVHTDPVAHIAADHLQARAFTHHQDIWLGRGESPTDLRLMAHETTHVLQQDGTVHRLMPEVVQRRAAGTASAAGSASPSAAASPAVAETAASGAASPVAVVPIPAVGIAAPAPRAAVPATETPTSVEVSAPAGAVPAEPGGEVELLMPEPPAGPSEADRQRLENVEENASDAAAAQRDLPSAEENVTEAREAVAEPIEETAGRAEGGLAAALSTRPEPSAAIEALCERILAVIHSRQPPDEESLLQSNPREEAEAAGNVLESSVEGDVERVEGSYNQLDNPPAGTSQQTAQSLESPATSVSTPDIAAEQAVPDAVPAEDVSLDADVEASAARMDEAGMASEPAQLVQSGPIAEARAAQGELAATAQRDPAEVLAEQQLAREQAGADMVDLQARALEALQASRAGTATGIGSQQSGMVLSEDQLRTRLSTRARGIFTAAQEQVDALLEPLTRTAMQRWETGVEVLSTQFERDLAQVQSWLDERYEGWTGAVVEFFEDIVGKPAWVTRAYDRAERNFADGVCALIREISTEVNSVIATCEQLIDDANLQIDELFSSQMPDSLREWAAAEQARFAEELQGLRNRVASTRDEFNSNLAERAAQSVQEVRERIHELRQAARGLVGQIADAIDRFIEDPIRFIIDGLLELVGIPPPSFWALVNRIQSVISDIADNPMNFANNLVAALGQGFQRFFDNFADHIISGFFDWLFSGLGAVGVEIPRDFSLKSIITFFLQLMGITWPRIRQLLARHIGEENIALLERAYEIIANLIEMGPEGIFEMIKEQLNPQNILDQVLRAAIDYLVETLIVRVTARVIAMFNPAGAIIQAIELIYRILRWIFDNAARIFSLVETVVNGAAALIAGNIGGMAAAVEGALARLIAPVIDFLAGFLGLGNLPDRIADTIRGFQEWVMSILERVIAWLADRARALLRSLGFGQDEEEALSDAELGDVKEQARSLLTARIEREMSIEQVDHITLEVFEQLRPQGLTRLARGDPDVENNYPIIAEASPAEKILDLAPSGRTVRMAVTLELSGEQPIIEGISDVSFFEPGKEKEHRASGGRRISVIPSVEPPSWVSAPRQPDQRFGGRVIEPEEGSRELEIVTWNTGARIRGDNYSDAERQFFNWFDGQEIEWRDRVVHIIIRINRSPCGDCVGYLKELLQILAPNANGRLTYDEPHRGRQATTPNDINELRGAGWDVSGPPIEESIKVTET